MLEDACSSESLDSQDLFAPLHVILPEELEKFFYRAHGYCTSTPVDKRCRARLNVRCIGYIRFGLPAVGLQAGNCGNEGSRGTILIKDLSHTGIAVLYHRQILPGEKFDVFIQGRLLSVVAVRCRRIGPKCYETGAIVNSIESAPDFPTQE